MILMRLVMAEIGNEPVAEVMRDVAVMRLE
jgi:hypothetical protein